MTNSNKYCTAYIGSATQAMKAQKILSEAAVMSHVLKIPSSKSRRGCGYGVSFDCTQLGNVKTILEKNNITVKEFL